MFLKPRTRRKDGKTHTYYSVCESLRVHGGRTVQRQLLHLGELNTTQHDRWQHTLEVLHADGSRHQRRLFTDRDAFMTESCADLSKGDYLVLHEKMGGNGQIPPEEVEACQVPLESVFNNKRFTIYKIKK